MAARNPHELAALLADAINRRDLDAALALWADDAAIVAADGSLVCGRDGIVGALAGLLSNGTRFEAELTALYEAGDTALGTGSLTLRGDGHDGPYEQRSDSVVVYTRGADGLWKIALDAPWGLPPA